MEIKDTPMSNLKIIIKNHGNTLKIFKNENVNEIGTEIIKLKHSKIDYENSLEKLNLEIDLDSIKINSNEEKERLDLDNQRKCNDQLVTDIEDCNIQQLHPYFKNDYQNKNTQKEKQIISLNKSHKILLFSPHPDDEILGACALLHKCYTENININVVYLTSGKTAGDASTRQNEAMQGIKILKGNVENLHFANMPFYERKDRSIKEDDYQYVKDIIKQYEPNVIFICADIFDPNKTHRKCFDVLTKVLLSKEYIDIDIYFYYSVWYTPKEDEYNHIIPYDYDVYRLKVSAMLEHKSQMHTNYMGNNSLPFYVRGVMRDENFGNLNNCLYCEVYYKLEKLVFELSK